MFVRDMYLGALTGSKLAEKDGNVFVIHLVAVSTVPKWAPSKSQGQL